MVEILVYEKVDVDDLYVDFLVPIGLETFCEDEDSCEFFIGHQSVGHTFVSTPREFDVGAS